MVRWFFRPLRGACSSCWGNQQVRQVATARPQLLPWKQAVPCPLARDSGILGNTGDGRIVMLGGNLSGPACRRGDGTGRRGGRVQDPHIGKHASTRQIRRNLCPPALNDLTAALPEQITPSGIPLFIMDKMRRGGDSFGPLLQKDWWGAYAPQIPFQPDKFTQRDFH